MNMQQMEKLAQMTALKTEHVRLESEIQFRENTVLRLEPVMTRTSYDEVVGNFPATAQVEELQVAQRELLEMRDRVAEIDSELASLTVTEPDARPVVSDIEL